MTRIAILASGNGTNAEAIIRHFASRPTVAEVVAVITNNRYAGVVERSGRLGIESIFVPREQWSDGNKVLALLRSRGINLVILAGFMLFVPPAVVEAYPRRIINLHPALLPRHGGKGMYGHHVHEAVIADGDADTGITIHLVDEKYDHGENLFQTSFDIGPDDTAQTIETRIHELEHANYPAVIEKFIRDEHL